MLNLVTCNLVLCGSGLRAPRRTLKVRFSRRHHGAPQVRRRNGYSNDSLLDSQIKNISNRITLMDFGGNDTFIVRFE